MSIIDFKSHKTPKPIKKIKKLLRILFLIYVFVYFYINYDQYTPKALSRTLSQIVSTDSINTSEIDIIMNRNTKISSFSGGFIKADKDILSFISASGDILLEIPLLYQNPNIKIGNSTVLAYNSNLYDYQIVSSFGTLFEGTCNSKILNASINNEDEYIIVTDEDGYVSGVKMYNSKHEEIFRWSTSKYNIISAKSEGNTLATLCIYREQGEFKSKVILFNIKSGKTISETDLNSKFPLNVYFLQNSNVAIILQDGIHIIDDKGAILKVVEIPNMRAYNVSDGHNIVYTRETFDGNTEICILDSIGNEVSKLILQEEIIDIEISHNYVYILTKEDITKFDVYLNEVESNKHDAGVSDIIIHTNGDVYGVFSNKLIKTP